MTSHGTLVLVPNTLDLGSAEGEAPDLREVLADGVIRRAAALSHWAAEDARSTRAFLKRVGAVHPLALPVQQIEIRELPRPAKGRPASGDDAAAWDALLAPALQGHDMGLISEAGLPGVADPGAALVAAAHRHGLRVDPLPGPTSLALALAASGLNGQSFAFVGYLPQDAAARQTRLRELEALSRRLQQTQLFIETPYRNAALMQALVATLSPATRLSVSSGLTLPDAWTRTDTVEGWRRVPKVPSDRRPTVFALLA